MDSRIGAACGPGFGGRRPRTNDGPLDRAHSAGNRAQRIQSHEDLFTTLAAVAGVNDVRERATRDDRFDTGTVKRSCIDGVDNLD